MDLTGINSSDPITSFVPETPQGELGKDAFLQLLVTQMRSQDPLDQLIARQRPWPTRSARLLARVLGEFWLASASIWLMALPLVRPTSTWKPKLRMPSFAHGDRENGDDQ